MDLENLSNKIDSLFNKFDEQFDKMNEKLNKFDQKLNKIDEQLNKRFDNIEFDIRDIRETQFYFEQTYGKKIDITYDGVLALQELSTRDSKNLKKLDARAENLEVKSYKYDEYEKRILALENNINSNI